jgi:bleomycin hydrolase
MKLTIQNKLFMKRMMLPGKMFLMLLIFGSSTVLFAQETYYDLKVRQTVKTNPSKDIQRINSCWSNLGAALIEAEMIKSGKGSVDLSEMDFIHNAYLLKTQAFLDSKGKVNVDEKCLPVDVFKLMDTYGMAPESAYMQSDLDPMSKESGQMDAVIRGSLRRAIDMGDSGETERYLNYVDAALSKHIGDTKMNFTYDGKDYTPKSFAEQAGVNSADYVMLTSDSRQEMHKPFVLEMKTNWDKEEFYNVNPNEMYKVMKDAIENGYAVGWYGFVNNEMIIVDEKVAVVPIGKMPGTKKEGTDKEVQQTYQPLPEKTISEKERQANFEVLVNDNNNFMTLYGISMDKEGNEYILGKDACTAGDDELNMSDPYLKLNTVYLLVNKNGLDKNLREKLGL